MQGLSSIVSSNILKMSISLNPIRGWLLGRQIGQFLHAIMDRIKRDKIDESIKHLSDLLKPIATMADTSSNKKGTLRQILKGFSKKNAERIANFYTTIIKELPSDKKIHKAIDSCA
jgi:ERCC4-type nuclease